MKTGKEKKKKIKRRKKCRKRRTGRISVNMLWTKKGPHIKHDKLKGGLHGLTNSDIGRSEVKTFGLKAVHGR